jgi:MFS family permease
MFLTNTSISLSGLFIPLMARDMGISYLGIGLIVTTYGLASFFSYSLFGRLSDIRGERKSFIQAGLVASSVAFFLQVLMRDSLSLILIRGLAGFSIGMFTFPLLAYFSGHCARDEKIALYVGFGSLGWFAGYFLAGAVADYTLMFVIAGILFVASMVISFRLKETQRTKVKLSPFTKVVKKNFAVYLTYFLRHTGAQAVWTIFPIYLIGIGANVFWVGVIHGLNTLTQFFVMAVLSKRENMNGKNLIRLGLITSAAVFALYSFTTSYIQVFPVQLLLGVSYSFIYVGSLLQLLEKNVETATCTGLFGSTNSLTYVTGPLLAGVVSQFFGMTAVMLVSCGLSLSALAASQLIK